MLFDGKTWLNSRRQTCFTNQLHPTSANEPFSLLVSGCSAAMWKVESRIEELDLTELMRASDRSRPSWQDPQSRRFLLLHVLYDEGRK